MLTDTQVAHLRSKATPEQVSFMAFLGRTVAEITEQLNGRNGKLLVVSEDKDLASMLRNYLTVLHFSVEVASMGSVALKTLDKAFRVRRNEPEDERHPRDYKMVILDSQVSDIDAFQLKKELQELGSEALVASIGDQKDADVTLSRPLELASLRTMLNEKFCLT